ncbi:transposase, partial [Microbacterium sp.]|uniref:transposase n=1 Tax=Microbacterium sp. TaxID=51671 RepID=UPI0025CFCF01
SGIGLPVSITMRTAPSRNSGVYVRCLEPMNPNFPCNHGLHATRGRTLLTQLEAASKAADDLAGAVEEAFPQHPDAEVLLSFPGLGFQLGARLLAEIGDDRTRFADARGLKAYAGSSPITRASGKRSSVTRRRVKNDRLNHAGYLWAFSAITASPGAKSHYRRRRDEHGDWHAAAQRNLFNRMLGQLYHCLQNRKLFEEETAFPTQLAVAA